MIGRGGMQLVQVVRAVVVACDGAGDPSMWVGTCGSGPGMRGRRPECGRGLSRAAVNGSGSGGGMYRAAATRHCDWGHVSRGQGWGHVGSRGEGVGGSRKCGLWTGCAPSL